MNDFSVTDPVNGTSEVAASVVGEHSGAVGTVKALLQFGQTASIPLSAGDAEMCCPQLGHSNVNVIFGRAWRIA